MRQNHSTKSSKVNVSDDDYVDNCTVRMMMMTVMVTNKNRLAMNLQ